MIAYTHYYTFGISSWDLAVIYWIGKMDDKNTEVLSCGSYYPLYMTAGSYRFYCRYIVQILVMQVKMVNEIKVILNFS